MRSANFAIHLAIATLISVPMSVAQEADPDRLESPGIAPLDDVTPPPGPPQELHGQPANNSPAGDIAAETDNGVDPLVIEPVPQHVAPGGHHYHNHHYGCGRPNCRTCRPKRKRLFGWDLLGGEQPTLPYRPETKRWLDGIRGRVEYIFWWTYGPTAPPLVTTSPMGTAQVDAGVIGRPGTSVLFGNKTLDRGSHPGGRYTLETMFDSSTQTSFEAVYTHVMDRDEDFAIDSSSAFDIIARPFTDVDAGANDSRLIQFPGIVDGRLGVEAKSNLEVLQINFRRPISQGRSTFMLGYRYANLTDRIVIEEFTRSLSGPTLGSTFDLVDRIETENTFHGVDLGVEVHRQKSNRWYFDLLTKLSFGETRSDAKIDGTTTTIPSGGAPTTATGGLLALPTNIGFFRREEFTVFTELDATVRYCVRPNASITLGYTLLFWPEILRATNQLDLGVNPTQIPPGTLTGDARPIFRAAETDIWAQGIRLGFDWRF